MAPTKQKIAATFLDALKRADTSVLHKKAIAMWRNDPRVSNILDAHRTTADYVDWNIHAVSFLVASGLYLPEGFAEKFIAHDEEFTAHAIVSQFAIKSNLPALCLTREIGAAYLKTEIPKQLMPAPDPPYPGVHILLPKGLAKTTRGDSISSVVVCDRLAVPGVYPLGKATATCEGDGLPGLVILAFSSRFRPHWYEFFWHGAQTPTIPSPLSDPEASSCADTVLRLVVNSWLTLAYRPELVSLGPTPPSSRAAWGAPPDPSGRRVPQVPRYIGWNFTRHVTYTRSASVPTGRKLRPHWRSGHWHTVRHGAGKKQARVKWFQPVYCCPDNTALSADATLT
jgi:hypothetical protein